MTTQAKWQTRIAEQRKVMQHYNQVYGAHFGSVVVDFDYRAAVYDLCVAIGETPPPWAKPA